MKEKPVFAECELCSVVVERDVPAKGEVWWIGDETASYFCNPRHTWEDFENGLAQAHQVSS